MAERDYGPWPRRIINAVWLAELQVKGEHMLAHGWKELLLIAPDGRAEDRVAELLAEMDHERGSHMDHQKFKHEHFQNGKQALAGAKTDKEFAVAIAQASHGMMEAGLAAEKAQFDEDQAQARKMNDEALAEALAAIDARYGK